MRLLMRFFGFLFAAGAILFVCGAAGATYVIWHFSKDLPDYTALQDYEPPVMTRVHAADGSLRRRVRPRAAALTSRSRRCPSSIKDAFISAEDKNFYEHRGFDITGIVRAAITNVENVRQAAAAGRLDHHPAGDEELPARPRDRPATRKIKERILAIRIERDLLQGQDPRALPQRDLPRPELLRRHRGVAHLLRQVAGRADPGRDRLPRGAAQGARPTCTRSASATARSRGATTCSIAWCENGYITPRRRRGGEGRRRSP